MKKILLAEDEQSLAEGLVFNLEEEDYSVVWVEDGRGAVKAFEEQAFDLVILDIMMPYLDGFEVTEMIRKSDINLPILILTAKEELEDKVKGLRIGADDYLTKPFHLEELLARIQVLLRRQKQMYPADSQNVFRFGENEINFDDFTAKTAEGEVQLTAKEADVMRLFISNRGKIISRKELLATVWNINYVINTRTVDNFIARLRKYFEKDSRNPEYIRSVRGAGYIFDITEKK